MLACEIWFTIGTAGDYNAPPRSPGAASIGHRVLVAFNVQVAVAASVYVAAVYFAAAMMYFAAWVDRTVYTHQPV